MKPLQAIIGMFFQEWVKDIVNCDLSLSVPINPITHGCPSVDSAGWFDWLCLGRLGQLHRLPTARAEPGAGVRNPWNERRTLTHERCQLSVWHVGWNIFLISASPFGQNHLMCIASCGGPTAMYLQEGLSERPDRNSDPCFVDVKPGVHCGNWRSFA